MSARTHTNIGHNSDGIANDTDDKQLESIVSRIVRLETDRREAADDIKDIYAEAKGAGWNIKALRIVVKHAFEGTDKRDRRLLTEEEAAFMEARLGHLSGTPLAQAAMAREAEAH